MGSFCKNALSQRVEASAFIRVHRRPVTIVPAPQCLYQPGSRRIWVRFVNRRYTREPGLQKPSENGFVLQNPIATNFTEFAPIESATYSPKPQKPPPPHATPGDGKLFDNLPINPESYPSPRAPSPEPYSPSATPHSETSGCPGTARSAQSPESASESRNDPSRSPT